ncbi:MAG: cystathionine beta-lyase, partial [Bacteroidetes bacterium]
TNLEEVEKALRPNTRIIYTETMTNPMLQISDIQELASIANRHNLKLVVDNTFTPLIVAPALHGAHIVVHSMTKFINGKNDCVAGVICGTNDFINSLCNVNDGTAMLLGPSLEPIRSSSILKNLHTLHIRMKQHSYNANYLAEKLTGIGVKVNYPGLKEHPGHKTLKKIMNDEFGFGGMLSIDMGTAEKANALMELMEVKGVGYLAVSLGYFKTLFSCSGKSTSSEIPEDLQREMGMSEGLVRFSVGLDNDIERTFQVMKKCFRTLKFI